MNRLKKNAKVFDTTKVVLGLAFVFIFLISGMPLYAVHDEQFELEGNVANDGALVPGIIDWADLFDVSGGVATPKQNLPAGFGPASFIRDFKLKANGDFDTSDDTVFATGSKDTLNPSGGWQCKSSNNVLNQDDLMNVYATAFIDPDTNELKLYFGAERNGNNGTKNIGFWFLKDPTVGCPAGNGTRNFTGNHQNGDLFIVSEFSNGGRVSSINVYEWTGGAGGSLNPNPIASGVDCKTTGGNDNVCATVNSTDTVGTNLGAFTPPWLTQTEASGGGESTSLQAFEFFEGGLNLTNLNLQACFTRFLVNTRSSAELGATIFDFAVGSFPLCGIGVNKLCSSPQDVGPNPIIDPSDYSSFITKFDVTIHNTGVATLYDVKLEEDASFASGETCSIIGITGCTLNPPAVPISNFENGTAVQVCDQLTSSDIVVRIQCDTAENGFINSVTARASTADNVASDLSASDTMTQAQVCTVPVNPALAVNKICHDDQANHDIITDSDPLAAHPANPKAVDLVYDQGVFQGFGVDVFVEIENTGDIKLKNIQLSDSKVASFTPVSITTGTNTHTATTFDGTLLPGQKAFFTGHYVATAPDNNQTDPCIAAFSDKVTVAAQDILGTNLDPAPFDTATCPLCVCSQSQ